MFRHAEHRLTRWCRCHGAHSAQAEAAELQELRPVVPVYRKDPVDAPGCVDHRPGRRAAPPSRRPWRRRNRPTTGRARASPRRSARASRRRALDDEGSSFVDRATPPDAAARAILAQPNGWLREMLALPRGVTAWETGGARRGRGALA